MTLDTHDAIDEREETTVSNLELTDHPEISGVDADLVADAAAVDDQIDDASEQDPDRAEAIATKRERSVARVFAYLVLPLLVLTMALGVGYLKWQSGTTTQSQGAAAASVAAATDGATAMLSYRADHVDQDLVAASERMTGAFQNEYTSLINDLVIPGAKEKRISAVATVPAAALLSAEGDRAQVLVYIDQTTTIGADPPTDTRSSARVEMQKVGDKWMIAGFEPI